MLLTEKMVGLGFGWIPPELRPGAWQNVPRAEADTMAGNPDSRTKWDTDSSKPTTNHTWKLREKKKYGPVLVTSWVRQGVAIMRNMFISRNFVAS